MKGKIVESLNEKTMKGLRGLLMGIRYLSSSEAKHFRRQYDDLCQLPRKEKNRVYSAFLEELESQLVLVGGSAVEDKLQDDLKKTIKSLRAADMKVWVLTGDKLETAESISISSGLFQKVLSFFFTFFCKVMKQSSFPLFNRKRNIGKIQKLKLIEDIPVDQKSEQFDNLLVHGQLLTNLYDPHLSAEDDQISRLKTIFEEFILKFKCVVFCRTTPNQKAHMVKIISRTGKITLAIGDGANDVNMIQEAHVGVGVIGNEGRQAANCSDFAIHRFKDLKR